MRTKKPKLIDPSKIGKKGGKARAQRLTPEERSQSARNAALARWAKAGTEPEPKKGGK